MSTGVHQLWPNKTTDTCSYATNTLKCTECSSAVPLTLIRNSSLHGEGDMIGSFAPKEKQEGSWKQWVWKCYTEIHISAQWKKFTVRFCSSIFCKSLLLSTESLYSSTAPRGLNVQSALWPCFSFSLAWQILSLFNRYPGNTKSMTMKKEVHDLSLQSNASMIYCIRCIHLKSFAGLFNLIDM